MMNTPLLDEIKKEAFISWGGRGIELGDLPVQPTIGYSNVLGLVPWPRIGLRFGSPGGVGISLTTAGLGIGGHAHKSFAERSYPPAFPDLVVNAIEDSIAKHKAKKAEDLFPEADNIKFKILADLMRGTDRAAARKALPLTSLGTAAGYGAGLIGSRYLPVSGIPGGNIAVGGATAIIGNRLGNLLSQKKQEEAREQALTNLALILAQKGV